MLISPLCRHTTTNADLTMCRHTTTYTPLPMLISPCADTPLPNLFCFHLQFDANGQALPATHCASFPPFPANTDSAADASLHHNWFKHCDLFHKHYLYKGRVGLLTTDRKTLSLNLIAPAKPPTKHQSYKLCVCALAHQSVVYDYLTLTLTSKAHLRCDCCPCLCCNLLLDLCHFFCMPACLHTHKHSEGNKAATSSCTSAISSACCPTQTQTHEIWTDACVGTATLHT
jgi:hypothetical protein